MNIAKNMEAIFIAAAVLLGGSAYATAALAQISLPASAASAASAASVPAAPMQVVVVSAKRLSPAQKASLAE